MNDELIRESAEISPEIVCAWGLHPVRQDYSMTGNQDEQAYGCWLMLLLVIAAVCGIAWVIWITIRSWF